MKKIALVVPNCLPVPSVMGGAIEQLVTNLIEENEIQNKVKFVVFSPYNEDAYEIGKKYKNAEMHYLKIDSSKNKRYGYFFGLLSRIVKKINKESSIMSDLYYIEVFNRLKQMDIDAIVAEGGACHEFRKMSKYFGKDKMYLHIHHHLLCDKYIDNIFQNIIGVSDFVKNEWLKSSSDSHIKSYTVKNCVNEKRFNKEVTNEEKNQIRIKLSFNKDDFVILYCGRIIDVKGVKELIEAVVNIDNPKIKLLIIGSINFSMESTSEYLQNIERMVKESSGRVQFTGYIKNEDIYKYYSVADIQAVPSLWEEAAGLVTIEGMIKGLPLIVTNSGGMVEYINNECAAIIDKNKNVSASISEAILQLYNNSSKRQEMKMKSLENSKKYTREKYLKDFIKVFDN